MQTINSTIPEGTQGIDTNEPVTLTQCREILSRGFKFINRYIGRESNRIYDLTEAERDNILTVGLGLNVVQHVESETSWVPSSAKGTNYGNNAVNNARLLSIPVGAMIGLDLEAVADGVDSDHVIEYGNNWYTQVARAGYTPLLYVGWHCGLSSAQLYTKLKFRCYWGAYNLNTDEYPAVRGLMMKQSVPLLSNKIPGMNYQIDTVQRDRLGSLPTMVIA